MMDGKLFPICKKCIKESLNFSDMKTVYDVLRQMNYPFSVNHWKGAEKSRHETFGSYIKMCSSVLKGRVWNENDIPCPDEAKRIKEIRDRLATKIEITDEMVLKWGSSFSGEEYLRMENFYNSMKEKNIIETPQDEEYLKQASILSMKINKALESNDADTASKLGNLFSKYMGDMKQRPMDKTDADKAGGIRTFGAIYAEVEKDGFIPPWEEYSKINGLRQDIVDKTIMYLSNFILRLNKADKMTQPPSDTPKAEGYEIDCDAAVFDSYDLDDPYGSLSPGISEQKAGG